MFRSRLSTFRRGTVKPALIEFQAAESISPSAKLFATFLMTKRPAELRSARYPVHAGGKPVGLLDGNAFSFTKHANLAVLIDPIPDMFRRVRAKNLGHFSTPHTATKFD